MLLTYVLPSGVSDDVDVAGRDLDRAGALTGEDLLGVGEPGAVGDRERERLGRGDELVARVLADLEVPGLRRPDGLVVEVDDVRARRRR